jgi:hypothetical protein
MAKEIKINIVTDSEGNALKNIEQINEEIKKTQNTLNGADFGSAKFNEAKKHLDGLNGSLDDLKGVSENAQGGIGGIGESIDGLGGPLANAKSGVMALGKQFLALLANPIVAIIAGIAVVLGTLFKAFSRTEAGGNKLNKGMNILNGVFSAFFKAIEPVANFIVDVVVGAFEELGRQAELAASGIEMIVGLFSEDAAKGIRDFTNGTKEMIKDTQRLSDLEAGLLTGRREQRLIEKQALIDAEKLRQVRDDDSKSIEERKQANKELGEVLKKQGEDELRIANQALEAAQLKLKIDGETTEALDGLAEAQLEILDIQERINGQQSEQLSNVNALRNEEKAQAKERRDAYLQKKKEQEEEAKRVRDLAMEEQKALRDIATQNLIEGTEKELEIERNKWDDKIALLKEKFGEESELVKANEVEKAEALQLIEDEAATKKLEQEKLHAENEIALGLELKQMRIDAGLADPDATPDEIRAKYEEQAALDEELYLLDQEKLLARKETENLTDQEFANQKAMIDLNYSNKKKQNAEEVTDYEEQLNKTKVNNAMNAASSILGSISSMAEEGSAIGKAAAVGQATMDTYKSATAAYAAGSSVGGPAGLVLGPLAAGLAVAAGVLNVKKILSTKTPGKSAGGSAPSISAPSGGTASASVPGISDSTLFANSGAETEELGEGAGVRQQTVKAVVVERDITDAQNNISNIEQRSEIG